MGSRVDAVGEQTSLHDRKRRAGQRLLIGLPGAGVDDDLRRLVKEIQPAGFILFARNVEEPAQVKELNRELASLIDPHHPALLAVDQEGGRVQRVREPATRWPPMRTVGQANMTAQMSRALAQEVRALGFNLNFAPVSDVDSNPDNPVIGDRSFSRDPREVSRHVRAFIGAHQQEGVIACAKHFPGHGDTRTDSHLELPVLELEEPQLRERELAPFRAAIAAGVGSVMSAHVVFPAWDEDLPATLSPHVLPRLLRQELGFNGVVFSDDLEMKAIAGRWSVEEQVSGVTAAGIDILLVCHQAALQHEMFLELVHAQENDARFEQATKDSAARVQQMRERFLLGRSPDPGLELLGCAAHRQLADEMRHRGA